jgi:tRNA 2-thiocytidine biosynthesis protein TtcA
VIDYDLPTAIKVRKEMVEAISRYHLIEPNDRVMVCVSGGKDSSILLSLLAETQRRAPYSFELAAVLLDQKQPGFDARAFASWVETEVGVKLTVLERDTYSIVKEKSAALARSDGRDKTYCALCSRMRRGILYDHALRNGFTKIALGHHRDDALETLLLNLFYSGKMQAMPPKFVSDDGRNVVIRPLIGVAEKDLLSISGSWKFPIIPCNLCGSQDGLKREKMKRLIADLELSTPDIRRSMAAAIANVRISHLADDQVWNFKELATSGRLLSPQEEDSSEKSILTIGERADRLESNCP